jgi:hypothetical protein
MQLQPKAVGESWRLLCGRVYTEKQWQDSQENAKAPPYFTSYLCMFMILIKFTRKPKYLVDYLGKL